MGGFFGNAMMIFPKHTPPLNSTVSFNWSRGNDSTQHYLFFSYHCEVCRAILTVLATNSNLSGNWHFVLLDNREADWHRTVALQEKLQNPDANPFVEILRIEKSSAPHKPISAELKNATKNAETYARNVFPGRIPVLLTVIVENPDAEFASITRGESILQLLATQRFVSTEPLRTLPEDLIENNDAQNKTH